MCLTVFYILWASIEQRYKTQQELCERKQQLNSNLFEKNPLTHRRRSSILSISPFGHHNSHGSHLVNNRRDVHQFTIGDYNLFLYYYI